MSKVPQSAKKEIPRRCKICDRKFKSKEFLVDHIENYHKDEIPQDWSASRYENYLRTGVTSGHCVVCKKDTTWNESTWKYNRLCTNPKCRESVSKEADKNMIGKYGKATLLNDPEHQRKMIYSKKNSGVYYFSSDDDKKFKMYYASKVELKFLEMLDVFLNLEPEDVLSPSPNNYSYIYEGENHLYIPDVYIPSINLEIELKEPKNNQNMHPKIQAVDKVKEKLKDELMNSINFVNYVKINGTDYREFFEIFSCLKREGTLKQTSKLEDVLEQSNHDIDTDDDDKSLEELFDEINQSPVTENLSKMWAQRTNLFIDIADVHQDYNDSLTLFDKRVEECKTLSEVKLLQHEMTNYKKFLEHVLSSKEYSEMHFQAKKAIERLDYISDKLDRKLTKLDKSGIKKYFISEGYDKDAWYRETESVTESRISGVKNNTIYKPVFIVLSYTGSSMAKIIKAFTHGTFSHSSLSLDTELTSMFSFNRKGFVDESIKSGEFLQAGDDCEYAIYMYMAPQIEYETIESVISSFVKNRDNLKYSIVGLINYITGKETALTDEWFCSEFVSYVLSQANPKLFKNHYSLYSPDDLTKTHKFIKVSVGHTKDYDYNEIDRQVRKILNQKGFTSITISKEV